MFVGHQTDLPSLHIPTSDSRLEIICPDRDDRPTDTKRVGNINDIAWYAVFWEGAFDLRYIVRISQQAIQDIGVQLHPGIIRKVKTPLSFIHNQHSGIGNLSRPLPFVYRTQNRLIGKPIEQVHDLINRRPAILDDN